MSGDKVRIIIVVTPRRVMKLIGGCTPIEGVSSLMAWLITYSIKEEVLFSIIYAAMDGFVI